MPHIFSGVSPYWIVNEFPKSGGTWIGEMLAEALQIPFPRNRPIGIKESLCHGHFINSIGMKNVLVVWRDPRDVMVSFYFHSVFENEVENHHLVNRTLRRLKFDDPTDVQRNLPTFIKFINTTPISPHFTWNEFANKWAGRKNVCEVKYEDFRKDCSASLIHTLDTWADHKLDLETANKIADMHSFAKAKTKASETMKKKTNAQVSFVREGSVGGWQKHFNAESEALIKQYCGEGMEKLGYEW